MDNHNADKQGCPGNPLVALLARGALIGSFIKIASVGLTFAFFLVIARATAPEEYGIFASAFSLATIVGFAAALGEHVSIIRFWPSINEQYGDEVASAATRRGLLIVLGSGCAVFVLFCTFGIMGVEFSDPGADPLLLVWVGTMCLGFALSEFAVAAYRSKGSLALALLPREILWRGLVIFLVVSGLAGGSAVSILASTALVLVGVTLIQLVPLISDAFRTHKSLPVDILKDIRGAGSGLFATSISNQLINHGSTVVIAVAIGPASAGAFFAADRLAKLLSIVLIGVNQITGPVLAREYHAGRKENVQTIASLSALIAFSAAAIGFVAYLFVGRFALSLFDQSYTDAIHVLLILSLAQLVNTACGVNGLLLNLTGHERLFFRILLCWGVPGLVLTYASGLWFGLNGAVCSVALTTIGWNVTALKYCQARLIINPLFLTAASFKIRSLVRANRSERNQ